MTEPVLSRVERGSLVIVLNRPERLNAFNLEAWRRLSSLLGEGCSSGYNAVVLTGSGRAFSSGDDIYEMYGFRSRGEAEAFFGELLGALEVMASCRRPLVAAVNGLAVGGGAEVLLLADVVVAARGSWFWFPESRIGLIPPLLSTVGALAFGPRRARYLALVAPRLSVEEARDMGLIDLVVEPDRLLDTALGLGEELGSVPDGVVAGVRRLTMEPLLPLVREAVGVLVDLVVSPEARRLMGSFVERGGRKRGG